MQLLVGYQSKYIIVQFLNLLYKLVCQVKTVALIIGVLAH